MLCCAACLAQQFPFVYYTPRDGLVNSRVRSIKQDSKGLMYFITYGGLSVYDGVTFKNYGQQDGLSNELINDIIEISPDSFLIATNTPALNMMVHGRIANFVTADQFYPVINQFFKSKEGELYFVTDDGLYTLVDRRFIRIPLIDRAGNETGYNLNSANEWDRFLFIIPWNLPQKEKLIVFDKETRHIVGTITDRVVSNTAVMPGGELWLSSSTGIEVIDKAALNKGVISSTPLSDDLFKAWKNARIYVDHNGSIWIYGNDRILFISSSGEQQILSADQGLKTTNLSDIFVDREGNTWMASDGNGIVKMPSNNVMILDDLVPGIRNKITALYQQSDTTWLYNRTNNAFYRIHDGNISAFPLNLTSTAIWNFYVSGASLYILPDQTKLYRITNKNLAASYREPIEIRLDTVHIPEIVTGVVDPNGMIIYGGWRTDKTCILFVLDGEKVIQIEPLSYAMDQMTLSKDELLWVPTRDHHLRGYSLHPESPSQYLRLDYDYVNELQEMDQRSITSDALGNLWIGSRNNGIFCLQMSDNRLLSTAQVTTLEGLTDNFPTSLYCDRNNHIWSGSHTGLDKIIFENGEFIIDNITKSKNMFMGIIKISQIRDDMIWALTYNGDVLQISTAAPISDAVLPSLLMTSLHVNDKPYDTTIRVFPHDLNNLSISVAAPSFIDEKSIQYSYFLQGSGNTHWSQPSNNAHFNFINLAPGPYRLSVKAQFPARMYPDQDLTYSFMIQPPYWRTWWFISLLALCLGVFLTMMIRAYYRRKLAGQKVALERKQAIEKERTRIATDMHDDLGAGLSRIKFLSDTIGIKKQQHLPIEEEIANIGHYAHDMIDKMGEIVWALNEKNDSLSDLLSYTRAYSVEYLAENGLHGIIEKIPQPGSITVSGEFRRNMFLSVKETLHNVIKHAKANEVKIGFTVTDKLIIAIQDDGIGFDPLNTRLFGNGLINIRQRMSEIGGEVQITNNHGTRIMLTAPLPS